jgi:hypothetical protein
MALMKCRKAEISSNQQVLSPCYRNDEVQRFNQREGSLARAIPAESLTSTVGSNKPDLASFL